MKKNRILIVTVFSLMITLLLVSLPANASSYLNGNEYAAAATRKVKTTKAVKVYRCTTGKYEAANRYSYYGKIKKGSKIDISKWIMSLGGVWVVKSNKYHHDSRHFFVISAKGHSWYKRAKKQATLKLKILKSNKIYFDSYTGVYLQAGSKPQKLYTSANGAIEKSGNYITFKSIYKRVTARWNDGDNDDILRIRVNSKTYYYEDEGDFSPYNSWVDKGIINSPYGPSSKSKVVLPHGEKYKSSKRWDKIETITDGLLIDNSWELKKNKWVKF